MLRCNVHTLPARTAENLGTICLIPGGPGLSSATMRSLDLLVRSFDLHYIDPPGTGGQNEVTAPDFFGVVDAIEEAIVEATAALQKPVILCAHSFGAYYAAEVIRRKRAGVHALVAIGSPLSSESYRAASDIFSRQMTDELRAAIEDFKKRPTRQTLNRMLSRYGNFYFTERNVARGVEMILADQSSAASQVHLMPVISRREPSIDFIGILNGFSGPKLVVTGGDDVLFSPENLSADAQSIGAEFAVVPNAGHFAMFDQPEDVARLIEQFVIATRRSKA